jgi:hypothetical protein
VLGPLIGELAASRQANEQLSSQLVRQAEMIGQLRAENRALLASAAPQSVEPTTEPPDSRWQAWGAGTVLVLTIVALVVLLLAWPG